MGDRPRSCSRAPTSGPDHGVAGVLHLVSEPTLAVTRACAGQVYGHVARRGTWVSTGRMDVSKRGWPVVAHGSALDVWTCARGEVPGLGLTDKDVGLLRG
jgi:hypothetical protein